MRVVTANPKAALVAGSTKSAIVSRMASLASPMGLAMMKPSMAPMLMRNADHQDDIVTLQLASVTLPIGMTMVKPTTAPMVMM
jgi:hypothetical protein